MKLSVEIQQADLPLSDADLLQKGGAALRTALAHYRPSLNAVPDDQDVEHLLHHHAPSARGGEMRAVGDLAVNLAHAYAKRTERMLNDIGKLLAEAPKDAR